MEIRPARSSAGATTTAARMAVKTALTWPQQPAPALQTLQDAIQALSTAAH